MESPALVAAVAACAGAAVTLLLVAAVLTVRRRRHARADLEALLAASEREVDNLRHELDDLRARQHVSTDDAPAGSVHLAKLFPEEPAKPLQADFVITRAGESGLDSARPPQADRVPDRLVLSATLGEPLVKIVAFSHGIRRALSPAARNRIRFEMRQEVRAARKRRRRLVKEYLRDTRAGERANEGMA
jgi:hypothetical protein